MIKADKLEKEKFNDYFDPEGEEGGFAGDKEKLKEEREELKKLDIVDFSNAPNVILIF